MVIVSYLYDTCADSIQLSRLIYHPNAQVPTLHFLLPLLLSRTQQLPKQVWDCSWEWLKQTYNKWIRIELKILLERLCLPCPFLDSWPHWLGKYREGFGRCSSVLVLGSTQTRGMVTGIVINCFYCRQLI